MYATYEHPGYASIPVDGDRTLHVGADSIDLFDNDALRTGHGPTDTIYGAGNSGIDGWPTDGFEPVDQWRANLGGGCWATFVLFRNGWFVSIDTECVVVNAPTDSPWFVQKQYKRDCCENAIGDDPSDIAIYLTD